MIIVDAPTQSAGLLPGLNSIDALQTAPKLSPGMPPTQPSQTFGSRIASRLALALTLGICTVASLLPAAHASSDEKAKAAASAAAEQSDAELAKLSAATRYILGLPLAGFIKNGGSDGASKEFQTQLLPSIVKLLDSKLSERKSVDDSSLLLDPSKLRLATDSAVRVYFVGEGAGYHNSLGYTTDGSKITPALASLIFPDASSPVSSYDPSSSIKRTASEPLLPGDFVDLGKFKAGTQLDFFLVADGANKGKNVYSTEVASNPDRINHVVAFALTGSPYLIMGFEDLYGGGDRDFNDVLVAVNIGVKNVMALTGTPEPATWLVLGTFLGLVFWYQSRRGTPKAATLTA